MAKILVVIDWYRFSITIDRLIDIDWYRLVADFVMFHILKADIFVNAVIANTFHFNAFNEQKRLKFKNVIQSGSI